MRLVHQRRSTAALALLTAVAAPVVTSRPQPLAAVVNPTSPATLAEAAGAPARVTELVGDGAWCWFQDPRAIHYVGQHDRTYVGYVTTKGDIDVLALDDPTGTVYQTVLHPNLVADDHAAPGIEVLPDGRIAVFYAGHVGNTMYYRVSTNPEDVTSFGPEQTVPVNVPGPYGYTYANPIYLLGGAPHLPVLPRRRRPPGDDLQRRQPADLGARAHPRPAGRRDRAASGRTRSTRPTAPTRSTSRSTTATRATSRATTSTTWPTAAVSSTRPTAPRSPASPR